MKCARTLCIRVAATLMFALLSLRTAQGQDPDYTLAVSDGAGLTGGTTDVVVTVFSEGSFVTGFQVAICDDSLTETHFSGFSLGAALEERTIDTILTDFGADFWSAAVTLTAGTVLSSGETHALVSMTYELITEGESTLTFCDAVLEPLVIIEGGDEIEPMVDPGTIVITAAPAFLRGDINGDGRVEPLLDALRLLAWGFGGGDAPPCDEAADVNDNGAINALSDPLYLLSFGFSGGADTPYPGTTTCGSEPGGGDLGCESAPPCPSDPPVLVADPSVLLGFGDVPDSVEVGEEFLLSVIVTVTDEAIQGIQFGVCSDEKVVLVDPAGSSPAIDRGADAEEFFYVGLDEHGDGWTAGMVSGFSAEDSMEPGESELLLANYLVEDAGSWSIAFCDGLGDPPVDARAVRDLEFVLPELSAPIVIEVGFKVVAGLHFSDEQCLTGETASVSVFISNLFDDLDAWHWGVCHDDHVSIEEGDVVDGESVRVLPFASHILTFEEGGWTAAAVLDVAMGGILPAGSRHEAYVANYTAGGSSGLAVLTFCDSLGDPPVTVAWSVAAEEVEPPTFDGAIAIRPAFPFTFAVDAPTVFYDPAAVPAELLFSVDLTIQEDPFNLSYPNDTTGFEMALQHDSSVLSVESVEFTGAVAALNGGDGPDFQTLEIDETGADQGVVAEVLFSFFDSTLQFETAEPVLRVHYALTDDALAALDGSTEGMSTILEWSEAVGPGSVENEIVVTDILDTFAVDPALVNGTVSIVPGEPQPAFFRGDCDGNGTSSALTDALYLLRYGFSGGNAPPCFDAADVDDSGAVSALVDALYLLRWQFTGGQAPPSPGTARCGVDPTKDGTACETPPGVCE